MRLIEIDMIKIVFCSLCERREEQENHNLPPHRHDGL
jgi:hypothetical protein